MAKNYDLKLKNNWLKAFNFLIKICFPLLAITANAYFPDTLDPFFDEEVGKDLVTDLDLNTHKNLVNLICPEDEVHTVLDHKMQLNQILEGIKTPLMFINHDWFYRKSESDVWVLAQRHTIRETVKKHIMENREELEQEEWFQTYGEMSEAAKDLWRSFVQTSIHDMKHNENPMKVDLKPNLPTVEEFSKLREDLILLPNHLSPKNENSKLKKVYPRESNSVLGEMSEKLKGKEPWNIDEHEIFEKLKEKRQKAYENNDLDVEQKSLAERVIGEFLQAVADTRERKALDETGTNSPTERSTQDTEERFEKRRKKAESEIYDMLGSYNRLIFTPYVARHEEIQSVHRSCWNQLYLRVKASEVKQKHLELSKALIFLEEFNNFECLHAFTESPIRYTNRQERQFEEIIKLVKSDWQPVPEHKDLDALSNEMRDIDRSKVSLAASDLCDEMSLDKNMNFGYIPLILGQPAQRLEESNVAEHEQSTVKTGREDTLKGIVGVALQHAKRYPETKEEEKREMDRLRDTIAIWAAKNKHSISDDSDAKAIYGSILNQLRQDVMTRCLNFHTDRAVAWVVISKCNELKILPVQGLEHKEKAYLPSTLEFFKKLKDTYDNLFGKGKPGEFYQAFSKLTLPPPEEDHIEAQGFHK